jgi:hypothetical protein
MRGLQENGLAAQKTDQPFLIRVAPMPHRIAQQEYSIKISTNFDGKVFSTPEVKLTVQEN